MYILASWCKEPTHWKRPWCWERLKAGGEGDDRGWHGWMASPTQCTWVWANCGSRWWTGRPGALQSMGSQRVKHDWATEQFLAVLGLGCYAGDCLAEVCGLVTEPASLIGEHKVRSRRARVYTCSVAHAIFLGRGSNLSPLPCKGRVLTTGPPGKPLFLTFKPEVHPVHPPAFQNCRTDPISF